MKRVTSLLGLLGAVAIAQAAARGEVREIRKTVDLAANGRVEIHTFKGGIDVSTWDRPQAEVVARIEPDGDDDRDQAEKVRETDVRIESRGGFVRIESDYHRVRSHHFFFFDRGVLPFVRYTIRMPRTAHLDIRDHKSEIRIGGLAAPLDLDTYKGMVTLAAMDGPVRLHTYKGEVRADYARYAKSEFETHKGSIEIGMPKQTAFSLDADLGHRGELDSDFGGVARAARASRHWREERTREAVVNGGGPTLKLRTYKGEFRLRAR